MKQLVLFFMLITIHGIQLSAAGQKKSGRFTPTLPSIPEESQELTNPVPQSEIPAAETKKQKDALTTKEAKTETEARTILKDALPKDDVTAVSTILNQFPALLNKPLHNGASLLNLAADRGKKNIVNYLLSLKDIEINQRDTDHMTPLMWAAKQGETEITTNLLKHGADPKLTDRFGKTASYYAGQAGFPKLKKQINEFTASTSTN